MFEFIRSLALACYELFQLFMLSVGFVMLALLIVSPFAVALYYLFGGR